MLMFFSTLQMFIDTFFYYFIKASNVITLTLGLQPKQKLAKVQVKSEAQESHFMLLGV
jgi:hypothetical protein